jgi:tetratricopeptide (TPR) repeat protein
MTNAVRTLLTGLAEKSPVVLVLDDLHWADEASLNLLTGMSDLPKQKAILIIGMLRPDAEAPSWQAIRQIEQNGGERFHSIHLEPLAESETDKLLRNLLGLEDVPRAFREQIAEKAGGNPFFVEELIRSLVDTGQIVAEDQHWRVAGSEGKISLPTTLRGVLSARIDRLPESARHTLQMAAVIGRFFDLRILQRLAQTERVDEQVSVLQKAALVEVRGGEGAFRHALIQDAAYDSILMKRRPELHRLTGEALEEMQAERTEEFAALLAHHFFAAEDPRSLKYDTLAGQNAARLYANAEAATHFKRALETGERLGIDAARLRDLYLQLGAVYELAGRYNEALENYKRLQALGAKNGDDRIELDGLMALATVYSTPTALHNAELAERATVEALEISSRVGDPGIQAKLTWTLMLGHLHSRRIPKALEYGTQALKLARAAGNKEQLAFVLNDLGRVHVCSGDFEAAFDVIHEARQLWRDLDNRVMLADNLGAEEEADYSLGHYDEQISIGRQALELSEALDNPWGKSYHRLLMGLAHFEKGDPQAAFQLVREGVELGDSAGLIISSIAGRCDLGWFYGWYGAVDRGLELTDHAIELARANLPDWIAMPAAIKVRLHLLQGDTQAAEEAALITALEPPSLPYPHYTLMVELAQFELAFARRDYGPALARAEAILAELSGTRRGELPQLMGRRGDALLALGRDDEALEALTRARGQAEELKSKHELWPILASLAIVLTRTGKEREAIAAARQARQIVEEIGRSIEDARLHDSFLGQPRVHKLLGAA